MKAKRLFSGPPVASIEMLVEVYPAAILMMYQVVTHTFPTLGAIFSRHVYRAFIIMLVGLCVLAKKPTARAIARTFGVVSHDALTRLLTHACWTASTLLNALLNQALLLTTGSTLPSYLILDDVVIPKPFSRWIAGTYWDWDHGEHRKVFCHRVVVVVWTNGVLVIPVAFAVWHKRYSSYFLSETAAFSAAQYTALTTTFPHVSSVLSPLVTSQNNTIMLHVSHIMDWQKDLIGTEAFAVIANHATNSHRYRTKNELARCLIYRVVRHGLCGDYITFDSWYASKENLNFLTRLGLVYYAAIPCSRNVIRACRVSNKTSLANKPLKVNTLARAYATRDYVPYPRGALRALALLVQLPNVQHETKLVIIKRRSWQQFLKQSLPPQHPIQTQKDKDPNTYLLTNNLTAPTYQVILRYRSRWAIEVMFRDLKQHFGLSACQHRNLEAVTRHFALVMFAYVCVQLIRQEHLVSPSNHQPSSMTIGDVKKHLHSQVLVNLTDTMAPGMISLDRQPLPMEIFDQLTDPATTLVIRNFSILMV